MLKKVSYFFAKSFRRKLVLFNIVLVSLTTILLFLFLMSNMQGIANFSLDQNKRGIRQTVASYLSIYTTEKANNIWSEINSVQNNLSILGGTMQKVIDNYDEILQNRQHESLSFFRTNLELKNGAMTTPADDPFEAFIPNPFVGNANAEQLLRVSALLNLSMDAVYETNKNQTLIYFVGNENAPVTRTFPNLNLTDKLGEALNLHFWDDFFPGNVEVWEKWYRSKSLQAEHPSPITVEKPYNDAGDQGIVMTMFYPLWDKQRNRFGGAVALDLSLGKIVEDLLGIRVAETGFAFLVNSSGAIIAMPDSGYELLGIPEETIQRGSLSFVTGLLEHSERWGVQSFSQTLLENDEGVEEIQLLDSNLDAAQQSNLEPEDYTYMIAFASLPGLADNQYNKDIWKLGIVVLEAETLGIVKDTEALITDKSNQVIWLSLLLLFGFLVTAVIIAARFSTSVTRDLQVLAFAAKEVSEKNYAVSLDIKSKDEISQLGKAFEDMTEDIRDYTVNLEGKVEERTKELSKANDVITRLNLKLKDENLRLGAEIDVAKQLQMMVLPHESEMRKIKELDIAGYMEAADEVGGDYYDVLEIGGAVYLSIGDVTGHGLSSGVIMLMAQTAFLSLVKTGERDLSKLLSTLNQVLYQNILRIREEKNMTLAVLQYRNGRYTIVGQHESVIICRANGEVEEIDTTDLGFPVGMERDIEEFISAKHFKLASGDSMMLYTDGVTEAENKKEEQFGNDNLINAMIKCHRLDSDAMIKSIMEDLYEFIDGNTIYDDITMVIVKQK